MAQRTHLAVPVSERDHIQGPDTATVTLVQYGDYECPYTRRSTWGVQAIQQQLGDQLRFVYRNFPLTEIHPHALHTAFAAEAADAQGKFWELHNYIFHHQHTLEDADLEQFAGCAERRRSLSTASSIRGPGNRMRYWPHSKKPGRPCRSMPF
jgi:protein-disulfide isomerase